MPEDSLQKADQVFEPDTLQNEQVLYPNIHDIYNLQVDKSLPLVKFENFSDTLKTSDKKISLNVIFPEKVQNADLFLLVNKIKRDMFYHVEPGTYCFKNIELENGENLIEIFYRINGRRSSSSYSVIIKEDQ